MPDLSPDVFRRDVYALVADLLPVLSPGATLDTDEHQVVLPGLDTRARVSTTTLLEFCEGQPVHAWPQIVEAWVAGITRQAAEARATGPVRAEDLRVQAVPSGSAPAGEVGSAFTSAFDLMLRADAQGFVRRVTDDDLGPLGLGADDALRRGVDQTVTSVLVPLDVRDHELPGGVRIRLAAADGVPYVSAGVTSIPQLAGVPVPYGALVAVPSHSAIVILPVLSRADLDAVVMLDRLAGSMHADATDPCSPDVFWFVGREAHVVSVSGTASAPRVSLDPAVQDVYASLPDA